MHLVFHSTSLPVWVLLSLFVLSSRW